MPTSENGKIVERKYWELVRAMSPAERYRKALRLNASARAVAETQILEMRPNISDRDMQFAIARRRYWAEPKVLQMIDEIERSEKEIASD